jgi:hypothetical protein
MRSAAKRLWAATSENEALDEACEQLATWFRDVPQIASARRLDAGIWDNRLLEPIDSTRPFEDIIRELGTSFATAEEVDDVHAFPQLLQPGETGLVFHLYSPILGRAVDDIVARCGLGRGSFDSFMARVRSRSGLVACLGFYQERRHLYSKTDRAMLSTAAELTSLALS